MKQIISIFFLAVLVLSGCAPQPATVYVNVDLGTGGSGFAFTLYAQEVTSGKTFHAPYASGSHGMIIAPTSAPVAIQLDAPGTYVFYAINNEAPDDYHYGDTGCPPAKDCASTDLVALDVTPGSTYHVTITDRKAVLPTPQAPVAVPWHR